MKVVLFGATGMVGAGALLACLADDRVESVVAIGRTPTGRAHPKLREVIHTDFFAYDALHAELASADACFFCLGVSSAGMTEADYTRQTYDLTLAGAWAMAAANPRMTFCYVSGVGTDSTERGPVMWARVKGRTENALLALPFKAAYMFRPGFIQPMDGIRSKTPWVQALYTLTAPIYPLLHRLFPRYSTTTAHLGHAFIEVAAHGYPRKLLYSKDIEAVATQH